jgi:hypothetical protein
MQLVHPHGWRLVHLPAVDQTVPFYRLYRDRVWVGDYRIADLLPLHGLFFDDFTSAHVECCITIDPSTHIACLRPAEAVDGTAHLPLCAGCRCALARMAGFPARPGTPTASTAISHLADVWRSPAGERDLRELAHHVRHPVAKILGWAEILHDDDSVGPEHARRLEVIYQAAQDLQRLLGGVNAPI